MTYQLTNSIFLSHQISQQYFQPWLISQTSPNEQGVGACWCPYAFMHAIYLQGVIRARYLLRLKIRGSYLQLPDLILFCLTIQFFLSIFLSYSRVLTPIPTLCMHVVFRSVGIDAVNNFCLPVGSMWKFRLGLCLCMQIIYIHTCSTFCFVQASKLSIFRNF